MKNSKNWNRLDNAAKIFPPTSSRRDTKVFRFVCELTETVDGEVLRSATQRVLKEFPIFRSVLKKGLFWYYFEESEKPPPVEEESGPLCGAIYNEDHPGPLFRVLYYKCRINLEVFHALADGTGALQFFRTLVFLYLSEKHGLTGRLSDYDASPEQKKQDAFYKYYDKKGEATKTQHLRAYRIRGERLAERRLGIIEGVMSAEAVLQKAHDYGATLSEFLTALLICAIYDGMPVREQHKPVVITVPVDLRRFFPAQTARNFFGIVRVSHNFRKDGEDFESVLKNVRECLHSELTEENLRGIIGRYSAIENNPFVRVVPLQIKKTFLRFAGLCADREDTAAISNIGRVVMPPEAAGHIRLFDVYLSTKRPQICLCSFGDTLAVGFSSPYVDTGVQRVFFRALSAMGIPVEIASNFEDQQDEEGSYAQV